MSRLCSASGLRLSALSALGVLTLLGLGLAAACSSDKKRDAAALEEPELTGNLRLALSARGESGTLYRLRDATFDVRRDDFGFFTTLFTENDPLATTLEATLPTGNFFIDLFGDFNLEKVAEDGSSTRVNATLISPQSQTFSISPNQETFVTYSFETNGEVVNFGQGRLVITLDVTETEGDSRRTVMETSVDALQFTSLRGTLDVALQNAGIFSTTTVDVYHAIIDSYNDSPGRDPSLVHCDAESTNGQPSLNGFPLMCPRLEGEQFDNLDSWFPMAFVNRLDLAPTDGSNCGQQRMIFGINGFIGNGRMFIIVESQIPNPSPECGIDGCRPIADFWSSLATISDPVERGIRLTEAFLFTGVGPFAPFMNANNLGPNGGQIRTNNFNDFVWTLREFHMQPEPAVIPLPVSVAESPNGDLWNDLSSLPQTEACQQSFLAAIPALTSDNIAAMGFPVLDACEDAESPNDFFRQDYAFHLSAGSGEFASEIEDLVAGSGLSSTDIANRARFAGSCMGCHIETSGAFLGNGISAPFREDFVHVSEFTSRCADGSTCFTVSEALRTVFLPHRINVQRNLLDAPASCGGPGPSADAGVGFPADGGGFVIGSPPSPGSGPRRTIGGQPVVDHAH